MQQVVQQSKISQIIENIVSSASEKHEARCVRTIEARCVRTIEARCVRTIEARCVRTIEVDGPHREKPRTDPRREE